MSEITEVLNDIEEMTALASKQKSDWQELKGLVQGRIIALTSIRDGFDQMATLSDSDSHRAEFLHQRRVYQDAIHGNEVQLEKILKLGKVFRWK